MPSVSDCHDRMALEYGQCRPPARRATLNQQYHRDQQQRQQQHPYPLQQSDLIGRAKDLYAALDLRLGSRNGDDNSEEACFFFGSKPTSLDASVFGHLAEAWTIAGLLDLLPAFENLSR